MKSIKFIAIIIVLFAAAAIGRAQTSAFTYQGCLTDAGGAANGTYEMQFKLFDEASNQVGSTITNSSVAVTTGVFTVSLDYGSTAFSGADRFLEIAVRPAGSADAFTVLSPRQQLTSAVYAIRAGRTTIADNATELGGVAASQYIQSNDSRLADARKPTAGSTNYIQNSNAIQANSSFNISGDGIVGGSLAAHIVDAIGQYNLDGARMLSSFPASTSTFLGNGAGSGNLNGSGLTFVGFGAGKSNISGSRNTFVGSFAGVSNTDGMSNAFFGSGAGQQSTGDANSFFGDTAGSGNTTGTQNSFFGYQAGVNNKAASRNSIFGSGAGFQNAAEDTAFFGFQAGRVNAANGNSFFGSKAGVVNTSGNGNSFFGRSAGESNTEGVENSFFGYFAGGVNKTAGRNSFFGYEAGRNTDTGDSNSFFGDEAGHENKNGQSNSFFGAESGYNTLSGNRNAFFGHVAGFKNETGNDSAYFGYEAGSATTASSNAMFGSRAGAFTTNGFANSFVGMESGLGNHGGFENVFIGRSAGAANVSGNDNTIIGTGANVGSAGLSFATAIGAQATVGTSNTMVLGRSNGTDAVQVPGTLSVSILGVAGNTSLCRNVLNQIANCSSSLRYKKDLHPFTRGLSLLNQLKPITFKWKADSSDDLGFGAEDIAVIEPLLVTRNDKGEVEGVKYDRITAVLVNAVKEQQEQIKRQQSEIESLKTLVCQRNRRARVCK